LLLIIFGLFAFQLSPRPTGQEISDAFIELRHIARTQRNAQCARSAINHYHSLVHDKNLNTALNEQLAKRILYSNNTAIISRHRNQIHHEQMKLRTQKIFFYELLDSANDTEYEPIYVLYNDIESDESWLQKVSDIFGRKLHRLSETDLPHQPTHRKPTPTKKAQAPQPKVTPGKPTPKKKVELSVETKENAGIPAHPQAPQPSPIITKDDPKFFIEYFADYNKIHEKGMPKDSKIKYTSRYASRDPKDIIPLRTFIGTSSKAGQDGALSFKQAENIHCWIQYAFPSPHKSAHNSEAPISNSAVRKAFQENPTLRETLKKCLKFYLNFIGFRLIDDQAQISIKINILDSDYRKHTTNFLTHTHNFARVTRILTSLNYHGLRDYAIAVESLLKANDDYFKHRIPDTTKTIWADAVNKTY